MKMNIKLIIIKMMIMILDLIHRDMLLLIGQIINHIYLQINII